MSKKLPAAETNEPSTTDTTEKKRRTKQKAPYIIEILTECEDPSPISNDPKYDEGFFYYKDLSAVPFKDTGEAQKHVIENKVTGAEHPTMPAVRIIAVKWQGSP